MSKHGPITAAPMSWAECAAAGMSKAEAGRHLGKNPRSALYQEKHHGLKFADGRKTPEHAQRAADRVNARFAAKTAHLTAKQVEVYREIFAKCGYSSADAMAIAEASK